MAEYVRGQLSQGRLVQVLDSKGIDRRNNDLNGANTGDQFVLDHQGRRWSVFYAERGHQTNRRDFDTEHAACEHLLSLLLDDPTTRRSGG